MLAGIGARGYAVVDQLLAALSNLKLCELDKEGLVLWIWIGSGHLLCGPSAPWCWRRKSRAPPPAAGKRS